MFHYTGTLYPSNTFIAIHADVKHDSCDYIPASTATGVVHPFVATGSYTLYLNSINLIDCVEFFYEFLS